MPTLLEALQDHCREAFRAKSQGMPEQKFSEYLQERGYLSMADQIRKAEIECTDDGHWPVCDALVLEK